MLENVGAVLSDLSKAFDCLTRDLHVSKAHTLKLPKGKKHKTKVGILLAPGKIYVWCSTRIITAHYSSFFDISYNYKQNDRQVCLKMFFLISTYLECTNNSKMISV